LAFVLLEILDDGGALFVSGGGDGKEDFLEGVGVDEGLDVVRRIEGEVVDEGGGDFGVDFAGDLGVLF
ncbi:hypothetical protein, partial [Neisseria sicca]|uniref:hypothetical protein n=1 Tax=Neisseria sicca TaxID=490 RepID=UPI001C98EAA6